MSAELIVRKRDQLKKLYTVSKHVKIPLTPNVVEFDEDDKSIETLELFLRKLTPITDREAAKESYKAKVLYESYKREGDDHPERVRIREALALWGVESREDMLIYITAEEMGRLRTSIEARVAAKKKWSENDYLQGLSDAWYDGLKERYDLDNDDAEAKVVFDKLSEWTKEVESEYERESADIMVGKEVLTDAEVERKAVDQMLDHQANAAQLESYNRWRLYFATFEDAEFVQHFFESPDEVGEWPTDFTSRLTDEYEAMSVGYLEGKD